MPPPPQSHQIPKKKKRHQAVRLQGTDSHTMQLIICPDYLLLAAAGFVVGLPDTWMVLLIKSDRPNNPICNWPRESLWVWSWEHKCARGSDTFIINLKFIYIYSKLLCVHNSDVPTLVQTKGHFHGVSVQLLLSWSHWMVTQQNTNPHQPHRLHTCTPHLRVALDQNTCSWCTWI